MKNNTHRLYTEYLTLHVAKVRIGDLKLWKRV